VTLFFKTRGKMGDLHQGNRRSMKVQVKSKVFHAAPKCRWDVHLHILGLDLSLTSQSSQSLNHHATMKDQYTTDNTLECNLAIIRDHITVRVKYFQTAMCNEQ